MNKVKEVVEKLDGLKTYIAVYEVYYYVEVKARDETEARALAM